jgi:DNA-binding CsgD family transcriptional regulator
VLLTDKIGRILFANPKAEELLAGAVLVRSARGIVSGANPMAARTLADAVARAADGELALGGRGIGIPLSRRTEAPVVAYVLPLTSGTQRGSYEDAAVAIFVASGAGASLPPETLLVTLFDLTPAEARVLASLSGAPGRQNAALALGMSENTMKTHLSRIFAKTETRSQGELVALVRSIVRP